MSPAPLLIRRILSAAFCFLPSGFLCAHPVPDIPVRSHFGADGEAEIRVEVDPRSFEGNPEEHDYLEKKAVDLLAAEELPRLAAAADRFVASRLSFRFEPLGEVRPAFTWGFRKLGDTGPLEQADDPAVLVGSWKTTLPAGISGFRLQSRKLEGVADVPMNVVFLNHLDGRKVERYAVLFPGEQSFLLDLTGRSAPLPDADPSAVRATATPRDLAAVFAAEVKRGFLHVVPLGQDHILFVLGLFLLSREWRPLVFQVTTFTAAHTLTLWLASAGWVNLPATVVEPIIAASIVAVAVENLVRPVYTPWRLLVVFIFGLIHGLGFAGVMSTRLGTTGALLIGLLGINVGVEFGQLAVLALAFALTWWIRDGTRYRKFVVIPGSIFIALAGVWWVAERTIL